MKKTTDYDTHLKRLFLLEYIAEALVLFAVIYLYRYVFFVHGAPMIVKLVMGLASPIVIVLALIRYNLINFKGVLEGIPDEELKPEVVEHIIKMTPFLNVREDAMLKVSAGLIRMSKEELDRINPKLMLRFIRLCFVINKKIHIDAAKYAADTTGNEDYKAAIDNNNVKWITGMMGGGEE